MRRDPQAVNKVLEHISHELIAANDKYNTLSDHDKGVQIGKAMFFFVNPEGSTEGGATALEVADRVAKQVDAAATKAIEQTIETSTKLASRAAETAQKTKQFIADSMQHGHLKPALAGGPGNAFEPHFSPPKQKLNDHTMAMSSDTIGDGIVGDGLSGGGAGGRDKQIFYMPIVRNEILRVTGHPDAYFEATSESPGEVTIRQIFKATLPRGTGNLLMSESLKLHNLSPEKQLVIDQIVNAPTLAAYNIGDSPERSLLAKCAIKALRSIDIQPVNFKYEKVRGAIRIVIETSR